MSALVMGAIKFGWAWLLPYAAPLLLKGGAWLTRLTGLGAALGVPSGIVLPIVAGTVAVSALGLGLGWLGWRHVRDTRAETAFVQRCNGVILAANSKVIREALGRAAASKAAEDEVRAEGKVLADRARRAGDDLQEALTRVRDLEKAAMPGKPVAKARVIGDVCLPGDIMAKALGGG